MFNGAQQRQRCYRMSDRRLSLFTMATFLSLSTSGSIIDLSNAILNLVSISIRKYQFVAEEKHRPTIKNTTMVFFHKIFPVACILRFFHNAKWHIWHSLIAYDLSIVDANGTAIQIASILASTLRECIPGYLAKNSKKYYFYVHYSLSSFT